MDGRGRTGKFRRGSTLRRGSRGEHVRRLQERLRKLGFDPGPVDGVYGYLTMGAVRDFQRHYGLIPDGVAGRRVLAALSDDELTDPRRWIVAAELHPETGRTAALRAMTRHAAALSAVSVPVDVATPAQGDGPLAGGNSEQTQESVRIMMGRIRARTRGGVPAAAPPAGPRSTTGKAGCRAFTEVNRGRRCKRCCTARRSRAPWPMGRGRGRA